jgi:hypothetical protein
MRLNGIVLCGLLTLFSMDAIAQSLDSVDVVQIRKLALAQYSDYNERLTAVFAMHNDVPSKDKVLMQRYDSLTKDSAFMQSPAFRSVAVDRALWAMVKGNALKQYPTLKAAFGDVQMPEGLSPYHQEVSAIILEFSLEAGDFATAYRMQNALHAGTYNDWKSERSALMDSLRIAETKHDSELSAMAKSHKVVEQKQSSMQLILISIAVALLLLSIVFGLMMLKGRKQLLHARQLADDNSEKEELVRKLEATKRELQQHLVADKKKLEPVIVAAPESTQPPIDLSGLNDEIQQGLSKIKAHCEAGKQGMSVPTYMSIVNDTTRLSSVVLKLIQTLTSGQQKS